MVLVARGRHSLLWRETTIFESSQRWYWWPEATTVCCDWRPQYLRVHKEGICSRRPPEFVVTEGHNSLLPKATILDKSQNRDNMVTLFSVNILSLSCDLLNVVAEWFYKSSFFFVCWTKQKKTVNSAWLALCLSGKVFHNFCCCDYRTLNTSKEHIIDYDIHSN